MPSTLVAPSYLPVGNVDHRDSRGSETAFRSGDVHATGVLAIEGERVETEAQTRVEVEARWVFETASGELPLLD